MQPFLTAFFSPVFQTVLSGTLVFVLGQTLQMFFLQPILEYKKTIGKIDYSLTFYSNSFSRIMPLKGNKASEVGDHFRGLASEFLSNYRAVPWHWLFMNMRLIVSEEQAGNATGGLIYLSNTVGEKRQHVSEKDNPHDMMKQIRKDLGLPSQL